VKRRRVPIAVSDPLCSECKHGYLGSGGVLCDVFRELVLDETVAKDCGEFDSQGSRSAVAVVPAVEANGNGSNGSHPTPSGREVGLVIRQWSAVGGKGVTVLTGEQLVDAADRYLASRHCTIWGQSHNVIAPKDRREAAKWLARQIEALGQEPDTGPG